MREPDLTIIPGITTEPYDDGYESVLAAQQRTEDGPVWLDAHYSPESHDLTLVATLPSTDAYWSRDEGRAMLRQVSQEARRVLGRRPLRSVWIKADKTPDPMLRQVDRSSGRILAGAVFGIR